MIRLGSFLLALFAPLPAFALEGPWCDADGALALRIEPSVGIWFNESTLCRTDAAPPHETAVSWSSGLFCRAIHYGDFNGDGVMETRETALPETTQIMLGQSGPYSLKVALPPEREFELVHCHAIWPN